jgi:hypothetical protein
MHEPYEERQREKSVRDGKGEEREERKRGEG